MKHFDTSPDGLEKAVSEGESKWVEFKSQIPPNDIIARHIVAFANTDGGLILFGVGDRGTVLGISDSRVGPAIQQLTTLASSLLPLPTEVGSVVFNGRPIVYMVVPRVPDEYRPVMTSRGEVFTRHADKIHQNEFGQKVARVTRPASLKQPKAIAFVAMSFRDEDEPALVDYHRAMERAINRTLLPIKLNRIDLVEGDYEISQRIMDEIDKAQILMADFTLSPRNVYFELGYARGKDSLAIIQTARKDTSLEFDVRNWRTIIYKNATELEEKLVPALIDAYERVQNRKS